MVAVKTIIAAGYRHHGLHDKVPKVWTPISWDNSVNLSFFYYNFIDDHYNWNWNKYLSGLLEELYSIFENSNYYLKFLYEIWQLYAFLKNGQVKIIGMNLY